MPAKYAADDITINLHIAYASLAVNEGQLLTWSWKFTGRVLILEQPMRKLRQHLSFFYRDAILN